MAGQDADMGVGYVGSAHRQWRSACVDSREGRGRDGRTGVVEAVGEWVVGVRVHPPNKQPSGVRPGGILYF